VIILNKTEVAKAVDIHGFLDRLETFSNIQEYYKINHLTPEQRNQLAMKIASSLIDELGSLGLNVSK